MFNSGLTKWAQNANACLMCIAILLCLLCTENGAAQQPQNQNGQQGPRVMDTLAVVNGKPISRQQLATECLRRFGNEVLESIINKELILGECRRLNIQVTNNDVNEEIKRRAEAFGFSIQRYLDLIKEKRHIDEDKFRSDIIWTELALRRLAKENIKVTPEEIANEFETEFGAKVQVAAIVVKTKEKAEAIRQQVVADPDSFGQAAIKYSIDPNSAPVRGMLPPIRKNLPGGEQMENAAFALQVGEISPVTAIGPDFMILKCIRHFPAENITDQFKAQAESRIVERIEQDKLRMASIDLFKSLQDRVEIINIFNDPEKRKQMPGVAALLNGQKIYLQYLQEECITRYGRDVLESEINRTILEQEMQRQGIQVTEQDIYKEIEDAARARGYIKSDGTVDMDKWLNEITQGDKGQIEIYVADEVRPSVAMRKLVESTIQVDDQDLKKSFEANFGPRVRVLAIVLREHRQALEVFNRARNDLTEKHFGELAFQFSVEPASRANYGLVPPIQMHGGRPTLEEAAFRLKAGELSEIVQVGQNWIIMYCLGRTTPVVTEFDAVKDELYKDIFNKKLETGMAVRFNELREQSQIDNFITGTSQPGRGRNDAARANGGQLPFRGNK